MSKSTLAKKLLIKSGNQILLINSPDQYLSLLEPLPEGVQFYYGKADHFDLLQVFVSNKAALKKYLIELHSHLQPETTIWICYPKKSSGITSDLEMTDSWDMTAEFNLVPVSAISINEIWTAIRLRQKDQVRRSALSNSAIKENDLSEFIDINNHKVSMPSMLREKLSPAAIQFFESLSYTNKKEYIIWIMFAKQEKTRTDRIMKMEVKLSSGRKNPSDK